jgi:hypothetical protein
MALRLGDYVVAGELFHTRSYSTHGWLALRDEEQPLLFELTGDPGPDLVGKHIRFSIPEDRPRYDEVPPLDRKGLAWHQIGPTGDMLIRQVRTFPCSTSDFVRRTKAGEEIPTEWKPCLYLEWFSQNGRVVIELVDPEIEWVDDAAEKAAREQAAKDETDRQDDPAAEPGISAVGIRRNDDGEFETFDPLAEDDDDPDDPYGLFPPGLDDELAGEDEIPYGDDEESAGNDPPQPRSWRDMPGIDEKTAELYESWDEVAHGTKDVPFWEVFDPPIKILPASTTDAMDDAAISVVFKELLMRLALLGVSLSICEHYTPRRAYRLLVDEILPENGVHPSLPSIGFVQGYMTSEHCAECDAEFDREFEERKRREEGESGDSPPA